MAMSRPSASRNTRRSNSAIWSLSSCRHPAQASSKARRRQWWNRLRPPPRSMRRSPARSSRSIRRSSAIRRWSTRDPMGDGWFFKLKIADKSATRLAAGRASLQIADRRIARHETSRRCGHVMTNNGQRNIRSRAVSSRRHIGTAPHDVARMLQTVGAAKSRRPDRPGAPRSYPPARGARPRTRACRNREATGENCARSARTKRDRWCR